MLAPCQGNGRGWSASRRRPPGTRPGYVPGGQFAGRHRVHLSGSACRRSAGELKQEGTPRRPGCLCRGGSAPAAGQAPQLAGLDGGGVGGGPAAGRLSCGFAKGCRRPTRTARMAAGRYGWRPSDRHQTGRGGPVNRNGDYPGTGATLERGLHSWCRGQLPAASADEGVHQKCGAAGVSAGFAAGGLPRAILRRFMLSIPAPNCHPQRRPM